MTTTQRSLGDVWRRFGGVFFVGVLLVALAVSPVALARMDQFGGAPVVPYAPYTAGPVVHTEPYAPYTAGPVVREEVPYAPYTAGPVVSEVPYAAFTEEPYAPYTAGPVVREVPYAPYTEDSFEPHNIPR